ncbi:MaoC family dehydratase [Naumannella cuiyingiana]|uniref:Acyl dehydratase n=1 Tax=Naumannella cuiyingiana TaxID=1347891 RepID=A0A7Z0D6M6_9ACTN|nr:MaoC family dehydratase [Naumannella cuiyingiana]NYI69872.1 acyl dehydratase [Naumannella cuiyingiana]
MVRKINSAEELEALAGAELGTSDWVEVTQERINQFADATGDHQWIHVDIERANAGPFGGPIAHGFLTLSMIPVLGAQISAIDFGSAKINYGLNKVRFMTPVPAGGRIRAHARAAEVNRLEKGIQLITEYTIELEGSDRPACVAEMIMLIIP